jgi:hypothetical protein
VSKVIVPDEVTRARVKATGNAVATRASHVGSAIAHMVPAAWDGAGSVPTGWSVPYGEEPEPCGSRVAIIADDAFAAGNDDFADASDALPEDWGDGCAARQAEAAQLFSAVLDIYATGSVFTADYYALDALSGLVVAFVDWIDPTHALSQSIEGLQTTPSSMAPFYGSHYYVSSRPASAWKFLHDGTGCAWTLVWLPRDTSLAGRNNVLLTTHSGGHLTHVGFVHSYVTPVGAVDGQVAYRVANATATPPVTDATVPSALVVSSTTVHTSAKYKEGDSPEWHRKSLGVIEASGASDSAPSSANPRLALHLGAYDNALQGAIFDFAALLIRPTPLTVEEEETQQAWIAAAYGAA